jgi:hypothetical protein
MSSVTGPLVSAAMATGAAASAASASAAHDDYGKQSRHFILLSSLWQSLAHLSAKLHD